MDKLILTSNADYDNKENSICNFMTPHNVVITNELNKNNNKIQEKDNNTILSYKSEVSDSTLNMSNSVFSFENKYDSNKDEIKNDIFNDLALLNEKLNNNNNNAYNCSSIKIDNIKKMDSGSNRSEIEELTCSKSKILEE